MKKKQTRTYAFAAAVLAAATGAALAGAPGNDLCANATPITGAGSHDFNTTGATQDGFPSCGYGEPLYDTNDLWYAYTPSINGIAHISTTASEELQLVHLSVWNGCGVNAVELTCSPNGGVDFPILTTETYLIRVGGYSSFELFGAGTFTLDEIGPPENDTCDNAVEVGAGIYTWDDTGAGQDGPAGTCDPATAQRDVWYHYFSSTTGNAVVTVGSTGQNTNIDSTITVFDACDGNEIACGSRFSGGQHWAGFSAVNNGEYWVRLSRNADSQPGSPCCGYSLQFAIDEYATAAVPTNTTAGAATSITGPGTYPYNNAGVLGIDPKPSCSGYVPYAPVWFKYTPTQTGIVRLRAFSSPNRVTVIDVFSSLSSTSASSCGSFRYSDSPFAFAEVTDGTPIYLRIIQVTESGNNDFYRAGTLTIEEAPALTNDNCAGALTATLGANPYSTVNATLSAGANDGACSFSSPVFPDTWYTFTPGQSGNYGFDTCSDITGYEDTNLALHSTCNGAPLACNDNTDYVYFPTACQIGSWSWNQSTFTYNLTGGTPYLIRVGNRNNAPGQLNIAFIPPPCTADFNGVNGVTVQDIFDFLTAWLAGNATADFNNVNGVTVQDIFDFLTAWLAGC